MYEQIFEDFFNNRTHYPHYIDPETGLLNVIQFAQDRNLGQLINWEGSQTKIWQLPSVKFDPSWDTSNLLIENGSLDKCKLDGCTFANSNITHTLINNPNGLMTASIFLRCDFNRAWLGTTNHVQFLESSFRDHYQEGDLHNTTYQDIELERLIIRGNIIQECNFQRMKFLPIKPKGGPTKPYLSMGANNWDGMTITSSLFQDINAPILQLDAYSNKGKIEACTFINVASPQAGIMRYCNDNQIINSNLTFAKDNDRQTGFFQFRNNRILNSTISNLNFHHDNYVVDTCNLDISGSTINGMIIDRVRIEGNLTAHLSTIIDSNFIDTKVCDPECMTGIQLENNLRAQNATLINSRFNITPPAQPPTQPSLPNSIGMNILALAAPIVGTLLFIMLALFFLRKYMRHAQTRNQRTIESWDVSDREEIELPEAYRTQVGRQLLFGGNQYHNLQEWEEVVVAEMSDEENEGRLDNSNNL